MAYPFVPSYHDYGPRNVTIKPLTIVVHMAEGGGTVGYLAKANPNKVSVHYVVEYGGRVVQMLNESHVNGSINPRDIRTTNDEPYTYRGATVRYGVLAAKACLSQWWDDPNRATIGIEVEGFARDGPNASQAGALANLVRNIRTRQPGAPVLGHRDFADYKACPGKKVDWMSLGGHGRTAAAAEGGADVAIRVPTGDYTLTVKVGVDFYGDADCTERYGAFESAKVLPYVGAPLGESVSGGSRAVVHVTGYPYPGDERYPTVVYVKDSQVGDPVPAPAPPDPGEPVEYAVLVGGKAAGSVTLP